ncbi:hypothetical protein RHSIM_Rhsim08G0025800 [Rhododendron simsii]|uniref:Uncharacterized protein n=1 Tax=Rhododendron simsii TaxID=118357 RepID=A0A834GIK5_RHOSS|nr:hypothetical protein RHSIM_Rhsim08G0025800 [Rhododendron simsii]
MALLLALVAGGNSLHFKPICGRVDIVGSINGVFCLNSKPSALSLTSTISLWNPVTKRTKDYLDIHVAIFNNPNIQSPPMELYSLKEDSWQEIEDRKTSAEEKKNNCMVLHRLQSRNIAQVDRMRLDKRKLFK